MMKKVIFVGGTSRSGSTLLDLILANDKRAMSLGEIKGLFHPRRKHSFKEINRIRQNDIWRKILDGGKKELYSNLIKYFPDIDVFVDSSKSPFWFNYHLKNKRDGYVIRNVLIHKTPSELANSFIKRDKHYEWISSYKKYHRKYFSLIDDFFSISYKDLVTDETYLEQLCNVLEINYFKNKNKYWEKESHTFFGSNSVKYEHSYKETNHIHKLERRKIKYDMVNKEYLDFINKELKRNPQLMLIEKELRKMDVFHKSKGNNFKKYKYNKLYIFLVFVKVYLSQKYYYYFPEDLSSNKK